MAAAPRWIAECAPRRKPAAVAAWRGNAAAVQWLLAHGADRNARNKSGKTAAELGRAHAVIVRMLAQ